MCSHHGTSQLLPEASDSLWTTGADLHNSFHVLRYRCDGCYIQFTLDSPALRHLQLLHLAQFVRNIFIPLQRQHKPLICHCSLVFIRCAIAVCQSPFTVPAVFPNPPVVRVGLPKCPQIGLLLALLRLVSKHWSTCLPEKTCITCVGVLYKYQIEKRIKWFVDSGMA